MSGVKGRSEGERERRGGEWGRKDRGRGEEEREEGR